MGTKGLVDYRIIGLMGLMEHLMRDCGFINPTIQSSNHPVVGLVPKVGIAPTSPPLQGGANLPQLLGETRGNGLMD